jgi:hypothetical protein
LINGQVHVDHLDGLLLLLRGSGVQRHGSKLSL